MLYESSYYGIVEFGDFISHHGVKGQVHGKRRWQNYDGSLTPAGRIHYGVGSAREPGGDYYVKKGTSAQRFTLSENEDIGTERKYMSVTDKDKKIYQDFYAENLSKFAGKDYLRARVYQMKLTTLKDMKVAGEKTYNDTFMELYNDPEVRKQRGWKKTERGKLYEKVFAKKMSELRERQLKGARNSFDENLQLRGDKVNDMFFESLRKKGYDAVEDQFSKKVDGTDGNLISLNPNKDIKRSSVREVKFVDGKYAGMVRSKKEGDAIYKKASDDAAKKLEEYRKRVAENRKDYLAREQKAAPAAKELKLGTFGSSAAGMVRRNKFLQKKYDLTDLEFYQMLAVATNKKYGPIAEQAIWGMYSKVLDERDRQNRR